MHSNVCIYASGGIIINAADKTIYTLPMSMRIAHSQQMQFTNWTLLLNSNYVSINLITKWITKAIFYLWIFWKTENHHFKEKLKQKHIHHPPFIIIQNSIFHFAVYNFEFTVLINSMKEILRNLHAFCSMIKLFCILLFSCFCSQPIFPYDQYFLRKVYLEQSRSFEL